MSGPLDPPWAGRLQIPKAPDLWVAWGAPSMRVDFDGLGVMTWSGKQPEGVDPCLGWARVEPEPVRPVLPVTPEVTRG